MNKRRYTLIVVIILAALSGLTVTGTILSQRVDSGFSGQNAYDQIERLVGFGPRTTGSAEIIAAGDYILEYLDGLGWETSNDWHTLDFGDSRLVPARNLIASYGEGSAVVIGGHYDTRIFTDQDDDPNLQTQRAIGANDNGSGTAVILEIARVISEYYTPQQEIRLAFFDAEDNPGIAPWRSTMGSTLYVQNLEGEAGDIEFAIIMDMVGDSDQFIPVEENSQNAAPDVVDGIWDTAETLGFGDSITRRASPFIIRYSLTDDHIPFINAGIPAILMIDFDYPHWHTTQDTLDKISIESLSRIGQTVITFLETRGIIVPKTASE